jgi:hypothetical protein
MFSIRQVGDEWEVLNAAGDRVGDLHGSYDQALAVIAAELSATQLAVGDADPDGGGVLPERWVADGAICFAQETGDGRDFTEVTWTSRDPSASLLPLMLQTETEVGHFGAVLAGYIEELTNLGAGTNPGGSGRFYDSEAGRTFRDMLLGGRRFGVSVDPGAVDLTFECVEEDEDGWCVDAVIRFHEYEIIGLTGTPFPAFAEAAIVLETAAGESNAQAASVSVGERGPELVASAPSRPPAVWFSESEPVEGDERLIQQPSGHLATPLTITDDGQVYGHLAPWRQCHRGYANVCVDAPASAAAYAHFHVGEVVCDDGTRVATGSLAANCDHAAARLLAADARDHYAHSGVAWADVRVSDGTFGPWVAGALRPGLSDNQLRVLRACSLSGDWRRIGGQLELVAALAVNSPGFPIAREALAASGMAVIEPRVQAHVAGGVQQSLVASGIVTRCEGCLELARIKEADGDLRAGLDAVMRAVATIERRTRHLVPDAEEALAARLHVR